MSPTRASEGAARTMRTLRHSASCTLLLLAASGLGAGTNLVRNPGFERGQRGWRAAWASEGAQAVADARRAHSGRRCLLLAVEHANVGIDSAPLYAHSDFDPAEPHVVSAWVAIQRSIRWREMSE